MSGLVVLGDALLDRDVHGEATRLAPDAPVPVVDEHEVLVRPGGAGLAAALAAGDGRPVTLVTALGDDAAGRELAAALARAGVEVVDVGSDGPTVEKVRVHAAGRPLVRLDRGGPGGSPGPLTAAARAALGWAEAVLVADYGRGMTAREDVRALLGEVAARGVPVVWDPHPRGSDPVAGVTVVTPNAGEADADADDVGAVHERAAALAAGWSVAHVCVTRGARGAVLSAAGSDAPVVVGAAAVVGDPCGAGDRFASRLAGALADGSPPAEATALAVAAATAFVAGGGAAAWREPGPGVRSCIATSPPTAADDEPGVRSCMATSAWDRALALAERVRAAGGTLVATGGCFDLLHAGHVQTLRQAAELGDALVVLLNDDASVARLKGPTRPLNRAEDRTAVLEALGCVDAVIAFGEDTPIAALERLRPHLFAKGGDYAGRTLPEEPVLARWGGRVAILPHLPGRSTTRLIQEATCRQAS